MDVELERLLQAARVACEKMSPKDRASMFACQALSWLIGELGMSIHEDGRSPASVKAELERMLKLAEDRSTAQYMSSVEAMHISNLSDSDAAYMIERLREAIARL